MVSAEPGRLLGTDVTGNGTFTTTGGGATVNAAGTYTAEFQVNPTAAGTFTAGSGWGASNTYNWIAINGKLSGTIQSNPSGNLMTTTISIVRNDYYTSPPIIQIQNIPSGATGGFDPTGGLTLKSNGRIRNNIPFVITNPGAGFSPLHRHLYSQQVQPQQVELHLTIPNCRVLAGL